MFVGNALHLENTWSQPIPTVEHTAYGLCAQGPDRAVSVQPGWRPSAADACVTVEEVDDTLMEPQPTSRGRQRTPKMAAAPFRVTLPLPQPSLNLADLMDVSGRGPPMVRHGIALSWPVSKRLRSAEQLLKVWWHNGMPPGELKTRLKSMLETAEAFSGGDQDPDPLHHTLCEFTLEVESIVNIARNALMHRDATLRQQRPEGNTNKLIAVHTGYDVDARTLTSAGEMFYHAMDCATAISQALSRALTGDMETASDASHESDATVEPVALLADDPRQKDVPQAWAALYRATRSLLRMFMRVVRDLHLCEMAVADYQAQLDQWGRPKLAYQAMPHTPHFVGEVYLDDDGAQNALNSLLANHAAHAEYLKNHAKFIQKDLTRGVMAIQDVWRSHVDAQTSLF